MDKVVFHADNKQLIVKSGEGDYCTLFIEKDEERVELGSQMFPILKAKILETLGDVSSQKTKPYRGVPIFPIMNLGEPHASLAASPLNDGGVDVYWLDSNFKFARIISLNIADLKRFVTAMKNADEVSDLWG